MFAKFTCLRSLWLRGHGVIDYVEACWRWLHLYGVHIVNNHHTQRNNFELCNRLSLGERKILQNFVWHTDVSFLGKQAPFGWITTQRKYTKIVTECPRNFFHFIADHLNVSHNFFMNAFLLLHVDDQFDPKKKSAVWSKQNMS